MKIKDGFVKCEAVDGWIAVPTGDDAGGLIIKLNKTGSEIWDGVEEGKSVDEIADGFVKKYGVHKDKAIEYVNEFISQLSSGGVIEE